MHQRRSIRAELDLSPQKMLLRIFFQLLAGAMEIALTKCGVLAGLPVSHL